MRCHRRCHPRCRRRRLLPLSHDPRPDYLPEHYEGKGKRNFCWLAETGSRAFGFIPKATVNETLGYKPRYTLQGFNGGRGIKQISAEQYAKLHALLSGTVV